MARPKIDELTDEELNEYLSNNEEEDLTADESENKNR